MDVRLHIALKSRYIEVYSSLWPVNVINCGNRQLWGNLRVFGNDCGNPCFRVHPWNGIPIVESHIGHFWASYSIILFNIDHRMYLNGYTGHILRNWVQISFFFFLEIHIQLWKEEPIWSPEGNASLERSKWTNSLWKLFFWVSGVL